MEDRGRAREGPNPVRLPESEKEAQTENDRIEARVSFFFRFFHRKVASTTSSFSLSLNRSDSSQFQASRATFALIFPLLSRFVLLYSDLAAPSRRSVNPPTLLRRIRERSQRWKLVGIWIKRRTKKRRRERGELSLRSSEPEESGKRTKFPRVHQSKRIHSVLDGS